MGLLGEAETSIAQMRVNVVVAQLFEDLRAELMELGQAFDRVHLGDEACEDRGVIAGSRTDFQDPVRSSELEDFGHMSDDEGLRNCLFETNRQGVVLVGSVAQIPGDEGVAWHFSERLKHAWIADAFLGQEIDEILTLEIGVHRAVL